MALKTMKSLMRMGWKLFMLKSIVIFSSLYFITWLILINVLQKIELFKGHFKYYRLAKEMVWYFKISVSTLAEKLINWD